MAAKNAAETGDGGVVDQCPEFIFVEAFDSDADRTFVGKKPCGADDRRHHPNLALETTHGKIRIHEFVGDGYAIVFSHPGDFTPVCTTELGKMAAYAAEFEKRGVKLLGLSCDTVESHKEWIKDIEAYTIVDCTIYLTTTHLTLLTNPGLPCNISDSGGSEGEVIKELNMVDPDEKDSKGKALPSRALHIVGPDKRVKASFLYPASTGRNMDEVLRVVDSVQKAAKHKVATPANWKPGEPVVIGPSVTDEEAKKMFPNGWETADLPSKKGYLRFTNV
uniref:Peroxiredoxin n=1 Tax=Ananas comosus var. bracteatus TaxID=296719 RepID=A0A6V7PCR6_ANACO|nr:unnamed protein product [Ananas comosus var. bracteatus]